LTLFLGSFRSLIEEAREAYTASSRFDPKKKIAKQIVDLVSSRGGRFLRLLETDKQLDSVVEEGEWVEVTEKVALEKAKQGLREKNRKKKQGVIIEKAVSSGFDEIMMPPAPVLSAALAAPPSFEYAINGVVAPSVSMHLPGYSGAPPPVFVGSEDPRLLLFQNPSFSQLQPQVLPQLMGLAAQGQLQDSYHQYLVSNILQAQQRGHLPGRPDSAYLESLHASRNPMIGYGPPAVPMSTNQARSSPLAMMSAPVPGQESSGMESDKEDAFLALSALSVADRPKFSEEQEALERALITSEERAEILADMFGKHCSVTSRPDKKARKDLDRESINFLVNFMRREIECIPAKEKRALLEAQVKCRADEFSDARLERFLRCEGMNAKVRTCRIVALNLLIDLKFWNA